MVTLHSCSPNILHYEHRPFDGAPKFPNSVFASLPTDVCQIMSFLVISCFELVIMIQKFCHEHHKDIESLTCQALRCVDRYSVFYQS